MRIGADSDQYACVEHLLRGRRVLGTSNTLEEGQRMGPVPMELTV